MSLPQRIIDDTLRRYRSTALPPRKQRSGAKPEFPAFPRLADGTRIETPGALPEDEAAPTPRPVRAPRPISDAWTTDLSAEVKP